MALKPSNTQKQLVDKIEDYVWGEIGQKDYLDAIVSGEYFS